MGSIIKKLSRNKIFYCMLFLIILMFPSTIYMQSDNNIRLVVSTIGIDKTESGEVEVTALAIIPNMSTDTNANLEIFSGKGKTISDALNSISANTGKHVGLAHCDSIILSLDITKDNIMEILDYFIRTSNLTTNATILTTDKKSKELIEATKSSNNLLDLSLRDIVSFQEENSLLKNTTIENFYRKTFTKSGTFFLPILSIEETSSSNESSSGNSQSSSSSSSSENQSQKKIKNDQKIALIQEGKFVREISEDEKFIYNLLAQHSNYLSIEIENINDQYVTNSLEVYQQVDKFSLPLYKFNNGKPYVQYEIWLNTMVNEIKSSDNFAFASIDSLQNFLSNTAKDEIVTQINQKLENTVKIMKKKKNDILGLYSKFNAFKHREWQEYLSTLDDKENYLENMDIKINLHINYVI